MISNKTINIINMIIILFISPVFSADFKKQSSQIFICPMHNHIQQDHSSSCPICGMDLVLNKEASEKISAITLSNTIKETINVLTENVRWVDVKKEVYTGTILRHVEQPTSQITIELLKPSLKWLKQGSLVEVEAKDDVWGDRTWVGEVVSIAKSANPQTHGYPTSIKLKTPYGILKPNWYITLTFYGESTPALVIPFKSILFDSNGDTHVVKVVGKNQYQTIAIKVGIRQDYLIQIIEGLEKKDKVVTDGQFLINAEKQLRENI